MEGSYITYICSITYGLSNGSSIPSLVPRLILDLKIYIFIFYWRLKLGDFLTFVFFAIKKKRRSSPKRGNEIHVPASRPQEPENTCSPTQTHMYTCYQPRLCINIFSPARQRDTCSRQPSTIKVRFFSARMEGNRFQRSNCFVLHSPSIPK